MLGRHFAHHPDQRINYIGFTTTIGPDDARDPVIEVNDRAVFEGLKTDKLEFFNSHLFPIPLGLMRRRRLLLNSRLCCS